MNVLLTNIWLEGYAGTELYVRDLATALHRHGIHVEVYSPRLGKVAEEIRQAGIHIVNKVEDLINQPDIIHAHHFMPTMDVLLRFKDTPAVYFQHDRTHPVDTPPPFSRIIQYVAVDYNCLERLTVDHGIPAAETTVLYNWVDTSRFILRKSFSKRPRRALVFSNYATPDNYFPIVQEACKQMNIVLDGVGRGLGNQIKDPENLLHEYDIVFAKAKAAMEALATGACVIVCDKLGLGGTVTTENFQYYRKFNFGMKTLSRPHEAELLVQEIKKYESEEVEAVAHLIRKEASFDLFFEQILMLYRKIIDTYHQRGFRHSRHDEATMREYINLMSTQFKQTIRQKNTQLANKDQVIAEKESLLAGKDQQLTQKKGELAAKDQQIAKQASELVEKNQRLTQKESELMIKNQQLVQKEEDISRKGRLIAQSEEKLKLKDRQIAELKQKLTQRDLTITNQTRHIRAISQSFSYRLGRLITGPIRWLYDQFRG